VVYLKDVAVLMEDCSGCGKKEDTTSPTVIIESLLLSCMMDAMERRDVTTIDIPRQVGAHQV
jgi:hypothetical protein